MILCVGASGAGKSTLLKVLQQYGQETANVAEVAVAKPPPKGPILCPIPLTIPTVGTDIITISRTTKSKSGKPLPVETSVVREIGGAMAPIWGSYVEPGRTRAILYVVDSSSPETIGASTVNLVELLGHTSLDGTSVLIVFTKADLHGARLLHELKDLMRLDQIVTASTQGIEVMTFNVDKRDTLADVYSWCLKFQAPQHENGSI